MKCVDAGVARAERETHDAAIPPVAPGSRRFPSERFFRPEPKAGVRRRPRRDDAPPRRALPAVWGPSGPYPHDPPTGWGYFFPPRAPRVIAARSPAIHPLLRSRSQINGECSCGGRGLHVITEADIRSREDGVLGCLKEGLDKGARGFLLLSMDVDLTAPLVSQATSFSCALGPAVDVLVNLLVQLPDCEDENRPVLYACENDHSSVEKLQFALRTKIEAVPCMVDRICVDLQVTEDGREVAVTAEGHEGSIVVLNQPESGEGADGDGPLAGDYVSNPENEKDSRYLYRKKLLTVNGMHTVIAFRTLCSYAQNQRNFQPPEKCLALPLLSDETITEEQRREIWTWGVAQLLVLMWEHGLTTMMRVHGKESAEELVPFLLDQLRTTLDRFFSIEDSTARVLGGGVSLRYEGRLLPTFDTITSDIFTVGWDETSPQLALLKEAGLDFDEMKETLKSLVDEARPFAAVDKRARHASPRGGHEGGAGGCADPRDADSMQRRLRHCRALRL